MAYSGLVLLWGSANGDGRHAVWQRCVMTRGIEIRWAGDDGKIDEIEYFCGIDTADLERLPQFSKVHSAWPRDEEPASVEYEVDARYERRHGVVHLVVDYREERNPLLAQRGDIDWGTNTIVLRPGEREGRCRWVRAGRTKARELPWRAFDVGEGHARPVVAYQRSQRYGRFRRIVLECDRHECVVTGEASVAALEAAHLVPARNGENDMPCNGIALRADLHRLFDAGLFTFGMAGEVLVADGATDLSPDYRGLLRGARLPPRTLDRVGATLALPQFRERQAPRRL